MLLTQPLFAADPTPAFERVTTGAIVQDSGQAVTPAWCDYDGDGDLDLFVTHLRGLQNALYRNDGAAGFSKVTSTPATQTFGDHIGAGWGDFDNDGLPDLFVNDFAFGTRLYRNLGKGALAEPINLVPANSTPGAYAGGWADYDADGRLDLLVSYGGGGNQAPEQLWHQLASGGFAAVKEGPVVSSAGYSMGAGWGDYDNDRLPDLFVGNAWNESGILFHNLGQGRFITVTSPPFDSQNAASSAVAWGDYDNDGDLDLFVGHGSPNFSSLYRNDGLGKFTRMTNSQLVAEHSPIVGAMWGDYDNDGHLDLFISNRDARSVLFRNLGSGDFARVTNDPTVASSHASNGCAWGDYDNDGFLDLVVVNWDGQSNDLYHNRGNDNGWLKVQLKGILSNASGIGAKIRLYARIRGQLVMQTREITSGDGWGSPELIAHFGLGDATTIERLVVEWPSGQDQEVTGVSPRQRITVTEPTPNPLLISPPGAIFTDSISITLKSFVANAAAFYTLDGTDPSPGSLLYTSPITLTSNATLKARLYTNGAPASDIVASVFRLDPGIRITPDGGRFTNRLEVALSSRLPNTQIRYTLDATDPRADSTLYSDPIPITAATTVRTRAFLNGFPVTEVVSADFLRVYVFGDDGIPSGWRTQYFGAAFDTDIRARADADPDQDGSTNRQEFLAGTNPLDPLSGFRTTIRAIPEIGFTSVPGKRYKVLRRTSVDDPNPVTLSEITATSEKSTFIDSSPEAAANPSFYNIVPLP